MSAGLNRPPGPGLAVPGRADTAVGVTFAVVVGALCARLMFVAKLHNLPAILATSDSVLQGTPQWRAFQNRLVGALLEHHWSMTLGPLLGIHRAQSFFFYLAALCVALCLLHLRIGRHQLGSTRRAMAYAAGAMLATLLLQDGGWLYPWDPPEAVVFALFFLAILERRSRAWFVALYVVAVVSKETAVFMGVWLCLQSFDARRLALPRRGLTVFRPTDRTGLALGLAAIVVPMVYATAVRRALFVAPLGGGPESPLHRVLGNHFWLRENLRALATCAPCTTQEATIVLLVALAIASAVYLVAEGRRLAPFAFDCGVIAVLASATALAFGVLTETRVLVFAVPFAFAFGDEVLQRAGVR